jgi:glucose/arabinose dehydrogenase
MRKIILLPIIVVAIAAVVFARQNIGSLPTAIVPSNTKVTEVINTPGENKTNIPFTLPTGVSISIFAEGITNARDLEWDPAGTLIVSSPASGAVYAIDGANKATVAQNLNRPHGLAFANGKIYIAETDGVSVFDYNTQTKQASNKKKIVDLPNGGSHFTRSILIQNNKIYVSTGSSCNVCNESDSRRAAIFTANLDGSDFKPFAVGLRNSVFMTVNPKTNQIWATEMGRDLFGDNTPPDEVNILREGNFGWPYCYGNNIHDPTTASFRGASSNCDGMIPSYIDLQAHSAPLGLAFWQDSLLVAFHGSWNRSTPTGYKIVKINPETKQTEDFLTGWLQNGQALGRPVDILVKDDKELYISDDKAGVVYKLTSE